MVRSVNVGGRNKLPMADFRDLLSSLGYDAPRTYLQSGNAVFVSRDGAEVVGPAIESGLVERFGLTVPAVVRDGRDLVRVLSANPLLGNGCDPAVLHVTFLSDRPRKEAAAEVAARDGGPGGDRVRIQGREVYLACPSGYSNSVFTNTYLERRLGATATTRNWRTVCALAELVEARGPVGR